MPASIIEEADRLLDAGVTRDTTTRPRCPSRGSGHVARVLGDNGGIPYVCTACGHSWS